MSFRLQYCLCCSPKRTSSSVALQTVLLQVKLVTSLQLHLQLKKGIHMVPIKLDWSGNQAQYSGGWDMMPHYSIVRNLIRKLSLNKNAHTYLPPLHNVSIHQGLDSSDISTFWIAILHLCLGQRAELSNDNQSQIGKTHDLVGLGFLLMEVQLSGPSSIVSSSITKLAKGSLGSRTYHFLENLLHLILPVLCLQIALLMLFFLFFCTSPCHFDVSQLKV
jgi:hypothetical protein